jgi:excinuclease UvrABC ATPase subunit
MPDTFSFRPKSHSVGQLKKIAQKNHVNLNRFIEEAVNQKIQNEMMAAHQGQVEQLTHKIAKVVAEHMGIQLSRPNKTTHEKINKRFEETSKNNNWVNDKDARPKIEPIEKKFGILKSGKKSMSQALLEDRAREKKYRAGHRRSE